MTSETDAEFLNSMEAWVIGSLVFKAEHRTRLFALARRGAASAARIERLEAALRDIIIHCDWPDRVEKYARAVLEERT